jgi:GT2 family glycosyltransferase
MTSRPFLAIFFPTKNDERFVATTLLALFDEITRYRETGAGVWLGVANDGSTDASPPVIRRVLSQCPCPHVFIDRRENLGVTKTLQELQEAAPPGADIYLRCDADARFLHSGWLAYMVDFLTFNPLVGVVAPVTIFPDGTVDAHGIGYFPNGRHFIGNGGLLSDAVVDPISEVDTVLGAYSLMRKEDWNMDTGYFLWVEDEDQGLTVRLKGKKCFSLAGYPLVHYNRLRASRVSHKETPTRLSAIRRAIALFAYAVLPDFARNAARRLWFKYRKPLTFRVLDDSLDHFARKWGIDPKAPDLAIVRQKYGPTELLWFEDEARRKAGAEIIRAFSDRGGPLGRHGKA